MAKVVAIAEKKGSGRVLVCTLHPDRQKKGDGQVHAEDSFVKAIPTDKRLPTMLLQINHVTKKVLKLPGKLDPFILWPMADHHVERIFQATFSQVAGSMFGSSWKSRSRREARI